MLCKQNKSCENLCCAYCNTESCVFRCYKSADSCDSFTSKKLPKTTIFQVSRFTPIPAPKGTKYTTKPTPKEFQKKLMESFKKNTSTEFESKYKYDEETYREMLMYRELDKPENRHSDLSKNELIEKLKEYDVKFSTLLKKEELRKILVDCEEKNIPKKIKESESSKVKGRKPRLDPIYKAKYGHFSKADLIKLATSKKIEVLPTDSMNDIASKIESLKKR